MKPLTQMTIYELLSAYGGVCQAMRDWERDGFTLNQRYGHLGEKAKALEDEAKRRDQTQGAVAAQGAQYERE